MSTRRSIAALVIVPLALLVSLVSVGVASARQAPSAAPSQHAVAVPTITIKSFGYHVPATVLHGALIKVINQDAVAHTVTSNTKGKFAVTIPAHASRTFHAPAVKGTYAFHCVYHSDMHGVLHVH